MRRWTKYQRDLCGDAPLSADKDWYKQRGKKQKRKDKEQKKKYGFAGYETWNFDYELICYILPRFKYLRDNHVGYPSTYASDEEYVAQMDKWIEGMQRYLNFDDCFKYAEKSPDEIKNEYNEIIDILCDFMRHIGDFWD